MFATTDRHIGRIHRNCQSVCGFRGFLRQEKQSCCDGLHYEQKYADNDQYNLPHVHVIYDSKEKLPKQELIEFLTTEYPGLFAPLP